MPEKPTRVGDLIKAKDVKREDVVAAISAVFNGKTALPLPGGVRVDLARVHQDDGVHAHSDFDGAD